MQYTSIYSQSQVSYYSDFLVRLAWVVEILAVAIGLTISVVMGLATYSSFEQSGGAGCRGHRGDFGNGLTVHPYRRCRALQDSFGFRLHGSQECVLALPIFDICPVPLPHYIRDDVQRV